MRYGKDYSDLCEEGPQGTMFLFGFIYWEATGFHAANKIYLWSHRNPHPSHSLDCRPEMIWHEIEDKRVKSKGPVLQGSQISRRGCGDEQLVATNKLSFTKSSRVIFSCPPPQPRLNNSCKSNNYKSGSWLQMLPRQESRCQVEKKMAPITLCIDSVKFLQQAICSSCNWTCNFNLLWL